jgi:hypothetical protein
MTVVHPGQQGKELHKFASRKVVAVPGGVG